MAQVCLLSGECSSLFFDGFCRANFALAAGLQQRRKLFLLPQARPEFWINMSMNPLEIHFYNRTFVAYDGAARAIGGTCGVAAQAELSLTYIKINIKGRQ
jgi:hypothetical protein